jgi:hypothetical protein
MDRAAWAGGRARLWILGCDLNRMRFLIGVGAVTAPRPFLWVVDQAGFDRVAMHVTEFFYPFCVGEDVEVVVAGLPDELLVACAGETLLEDLDGGG